MASKDAELKIGADTSEASAEFEKMANNAMTAGQRIQSAMREAGVQMSQAMIAATDKVNAEFSKLIHLAKEFQGVMLAVGAAIAGGSAFKGMVDESVKLTTESTKMGKALGMSATEASVLNVALGDVHVSSETFLSANDKMTKMLRTNEQAFTDLGVKTRDTNGNFRSSVDIMLDVNGRLSAFKEGVDRNIEGQKIYGRAWSEVAGTLKLTKEAMAEAQAKAESLGLVVGQENVDAAKRYRAATQDVKDVMDGLKKAVGDALLPILSDLAEWFNSIGPAAVVTIKGAIGGLAAVFHGFKFAVELVWQAVAYQIEVITIRILMFSDIAAKALKLDFAGAKAAWQSGTEQLQEVAEKRLKNVVDAAEKTRASLWNLFAPPTATKAAGGSESSEGGPKPEKKTPKEKSRMGEWDAELAETKVFFQKKYDLQEYSKQQELEYWQSILRNVRVTHDEKIAIVRKASQLELEILKQAAHQKHALDAETINAVEKNAEDALKMDEGLASRELALGTITQTQLLKQQEGFEARRFDIQQTAQAARITAQLGDPNQDPVALQKLLDQMEAIQRKHALAVQKIQTDQDVAQLKTIQGYMKPIESAFDTSIKGMILGTTTLKKALSNVAMAIAGEFVNLGVKMATHWIATEILKTQATVAGVAARGAAEEAGAGQSLMISAGTAIKEIINDAWEAMAAAFKAIVGIPVVGPALAPAAGAAAFATVSGFAGSILSARGGYDIPASINPMVQLHEREMVLPQEQADAVRRMSDDGASDAGAVHLHFHGGGMMDHNAFGKWVKSHSHVLAPALRQLHRNFTPVGS